MAATHLLEAPYQAYYDVALETYVQYLYNGKNAGLSFGTLKTAVLLYTTCFHSTSHLCLDPGYPDAAGRVQLGHHIPFTTSMVLLCMDRHFAAHRICSFKAGILQESGARREFGTWSTLDAYAIAL